MMVDSKRDELINITDHAIKRSFRDYIFYGMQCTRASAF